MRSGWWIGVLLASAGSAWAQEQEKEKPTPIFRFEDGLKFETEDGNFTAHVGGRVLAHYRGVLERDGSRVGENTFLLRQARLEISGTFFKDFQFKVQADFPTGSGSTSGTLQDAFVGWKKYKQASVLIGQFKEPFSQEETTSTRFIDFDERSVVNRLAPGRDIGIMVYGSFGGGIFEYETGVWNGQGRAVTDGNDDKDWAIRLRSSPFAGGETEALKGLRIGAAFTVGHQTKASPDGLDFTSTELNVKFFDSDESVKTNFLDGRRLRYGAELSYLYGPFGFRAEWIRRIDEVDTATENDEDIFLEGFYLAATWLVTGEKKPQENRLVPAHPFDLEIGDWGAVELAVRVAWLAVDDDTFDLGFAKTTGNADRVTTFTFGVNWYLTRNFRISPNVVHERYNEDIAFQNTESDNATGAIVRFQIDF